MNKLLLTFYGDDFTGSTDALEQLTLGGIRTMLFVEPPTRAQLKRFPDVQAIGVAGMTRAMTPREMTAELRPALQKLKKLGARHLHYKVCSTFDSSPRIGSIGTVLDIAAKMFPEPFVPVLAAAPALGRYTVFGNHFARFGIGRAGEIHRLDRHPSISKHPVTPMTEADLRLHLAKQTKKEIALFDVLKLALPEPESLAAFNRILKQRPDIILFDALTDEHLERIGKLLDIFASAYRPFFSVGSSGIETALTGVWAGRGALARIQANRQVDPTDQILVGSGSCSPVTSGQITWALRNGFAEVAVNAATLCGKDSEREISHASNLARELLKRGRSVIVHTTKSGSEKRIAAKLKGRTAKVLGTAIGRIIRGSLEQVNVRRICVAGGDTSSFAARAFGVEALEMIAPLTTGAPLCRALAPDSPVNGREVVFKGGQVGAENYFEIVKRGKI